MINRQIGLWVAFDFNSPLIIRLKGQQSKRIHNLLIWLVTWVLCPPYYIISVSQLLRQNNPCSKIQTKQRGVFQPFWLLFFQDYLKLAYLVNAEKNELLYPGIRTHRFYFSALRWHGCFHRPALPLPHNLDVLQCLQIRRIRPDRFQLFNICLSLRSVQVLSLPRKGSQLKRHSTPEGFTIKILHVYIPMVKGSKYTHC